MRLKLDKEADALYFRLSEVAIAESEEVAPGVILDFDADGCVVGLEFLAVSTRVEPSQLSTLHFEAV